MRVEVKEGIARFSVDVIVSITQCLTFTEIARLARCARTLNSCASLRLEGEVSPALARRQTLEDPAVLQKLTSAGARRRLLERARNLRSIVAPPSSRELLIEAHNSLSSSLRALNFVHTGSPDPMLFCAKDRLAVALSVLPHIHSLGLVCFRSPLKMSQLPDAIVTRTELRQLRIHMFEFSDVELDKLLGACPCLEFLAVTAMFTTAAASRVPNLSKLWLHPVGTFVVSTLQPLQRLEKLLLVSTVSRRLVLAPGACRCSAAFLRALGSVGFASVARRHCTREPSHARVATDRRRPEDNGLAHGADAPAALHRSVHGGVRFTAALSRSHGPQAAS